MNILQKWLLFCFIFSLGGCALKWEPALREARDNLPTPKSIRLLADANQLYGRVNNHDSLLKSIAAYEKVLKNNPGDYEALVQLSNQYILLGTAHTKGRGRKSAHFKKAMRYAELAMYTNTQFKEHVNGGTALYEATAALCKEETEAMFFWVTALQYQFKEGMPLVGKIRNVAWLRRCLLFLDRIEEVNPEFGNGGVEFAKFICYYVLPKSKGGSKRKGEAYLEKAVAKGKHRLLPRWGRGKYYYTVTGNDKKSREDLLWVAAQDPSKFEDPYPWRVYFQNDARALLN